MLKYRIVNFVQKRVVNPWVRWVLMRGWRMPGYALLETTGHRSGQPRRVPVGDGQVGTTFWIVAEHGRRAAYVRNLEADPRVRVRVRGRWHDGTAAVLEDDDPRERQRWLGRSRPLTRFNSTVVRALGTDLLSIRIDLDA